MARYNKCANPALGANANDWVGTGGTGSGRVSVTGFDRPWGIRRTGQTTTMWVAPPYNAAASGETWTDSLYAKASVSQEVRVYVRAYDSVGTKLSETTVAYVTLAAGVVSRLSATLTMPALTAFQRIEVYYEAAAAADTVDFTMALSEPVATLGSYFDGETPTASWDGVAHNSTSTQQDPQFARPDTDVTSVGTWADQAGATTGLWQTIDETVPASADYIQAAAPASGDLYECSLTDVIDPALSSGHVVRYRHYKSPDAAGKQIDATVELRQGATVIASWAHTNLGALAADTDRPTAQELTAAQADAITSYPDLRLRFLPASVGGGQARDYRVDFAELEVPYTSSTATTRQLDASSNGVSTTTGALTVVDQLAGTTAGTSTTTGSLDHVHRVTVTSAGASGTSGALTVGSTVQQFTATSTGTSATAGSFTRVGALTATSSGIGGTAGSLVAGGVVALTGTSHGVSATSGALTGIRSATGTSIGSSTTSGLLLRVVILQGASTGSATTTGTLAAVGPVPLAGETTGLSTTSATLRKVVTFTATSPGLGATSGALANPAILVGWPPTAGPPNPRRLASAGAPTTRGASAGAPVTSHGSTAGGPT